MNKLPSDERDKIAQRLTSEADAAGESYRLTRDEYVRTCERVWTTAPGDPEGAHAVYVAAKEVRMTRKHYRRTKRVLTGFTAP